MVYNYPPEAKVCASEGQVGVHLYSYHDWCAGLESHARGIRDRYEHEPCPSMGCQQPKVPSSLVRWSPSLHLQVEKFSRGSRIVHVDYRVTV